MPTPSTALATSFRKNPDDRGGADGIDTVYSTISFNLSTSTTVIGEIENLTLAGSDNINGVGNWMGNFMVGNSGSNVLNGGAGADWLSGMAGRDNYVVDNTGDTVDESMAGSNGIDIVSSYISFNLSNAKAVHGAVEDLVLLGSDRPECNRQWAGQPHHRQCRQQCH